MAINDVMEDCDKYLGAAVMIARETREYYRSGYTDGGEKCALLANYYVAKAKDIVSIFVQSLGRNHRTEDDAIIFKMFKMIDNDEKRVNDTIEEGLVW